MINGNFFVCVFLAYYTSYIVKIIFNKKVRENIVINNIKIEDLRQKSWLTLEEQKEFISLKYPKRKGKFKFSWKWLGIFLLKIAFFIYLLRVWLWSFSLYNINFVLWQAILFIIVFPMLMNIVLSKIKLQKNDLSIFLKGWFK